MKKAGIIIGILTGAAAIAGAFFLLKPKKVVDEKAIDQNSETTTPDETSVKPIVKPKVQPAGPNKTGPGFQSVPVKPKPAPAPAKSAAPTKKMWVYSKSAGVKAYKQSTNRMQTFGDVYKTYKKGEIMGTYAGSNVANQQKYIKVKDGSTFIFVPETQIYTKTI